MSYDELAGYLTPRASAAGVVQQVHVQRGDLVSPGTAIADITDTSTLKVTLPFQSADAAGIAPGQSAQVTIAGTLETLPGTVESVSSADLVGTGGALVRQVTIRLSNPGALTTDHSATATVGRSPAPGSGTFEANSRQTVVAQTSGEVTAVHVTAGSQVYGGTALVTIGGEAADSALADAAISVENAQLSLQRAQDALEDYTITSPISGTVIEKNFKAGDRMNGMDAGALAVIYDLSSLELQMNVSELEIGPGPAGPGGGDHRRALPGQTFVGRVDRCEHQRHHHRRLYHLSGHRAPGGVRRADPGDERVRGYHHFPGGGGPVCPGGGGEQRQHRSGGRRGRPGGGRHHGSRPLQSGAREVTLGGGDEDYVRSPPAWRRARWCWCPSSPPGPGERGDGGDRGLRQVGHLIELRDVYKIYQMGEDSVHALDGVTITIDQGEFVAIVGSSGSGKSTAMNIIGCLDVPTSGTYHLAVWMCPPCMTTSRRRSATRCWASSFSSTT